MINNDSIDYEGRRRKEGRNKVIIFVGGKPVWSLVPIVRT